MSKTRLEAFSDGVVAILITILVLELKVPHGSDLAALAPLAPVFGAYVLSFIYLGIYWNNHLHLLHATSRVRGGVLWANLHLLFWLSLIPFTTAWMGENGFAQLPVSIYGVNLFAAGVAYLILQRTIIAAEGSSSRLASVLGRDTKGKASAIAYLAAIGLSFWHSAISLFIYAAVAALWLIPDRRIERGLDAA